ncbi:hypothetical protein OH786_14405 [Streptomyces atratus]|uniref:hypothetical protein n=1 Tax=Streptomyces atratus TaxID=1893 RepID=UPI0015A6D4F2|nr:hypothetical protein [Streptomyces atratus]
MADHITSQNANAAPAMKVAVPEPVRPAVAGSAVHCAHITGTGQKGLHTIAFGGGNARVPR